MPLTRTLAIADGDGVYAALIEAHRGLTAADSAALNARLVLLLANHIADAEIISEAIEAARRSPGAPQSSDFATG